jgi:hypothetical protein
VRAEDSLPATHPRDAAGSVPGETTRGPRIAQGIGPARVLGGDEGRDDAPADACASDRDARGGAYGGRDRRATIRPLGPRFRARIPQPDLDTQRGAEAIPTKAELVCRSQGTTTAGRCQHGRWWAEAHGRAAVDAGPSVPAYGSTAALAMRRRRCPGSGFRPRQNGLNSPVGPPPALSIRWSPIHFPARHRRRAGH